MPFERRSDDWIFLLPACKKSHLSETSLLECALHGIYNLENSTPHITLLTYLIPVGADIVSLWSLKVDKGYNNYEELGRQMTQN